MWDWFSSETTREFLGAGFAWIITASLLLAGLAGCVIPVLPGHLLILLGVIAHRLLLGAESGIFWWSFLILLLFMAISQTIEFFSGAAGAKWFGGTKWGALGALIGGVVGLFFFPVGLLAGPLIGAVALELSCAKQDANKAMVSGMGSVAGTLVGIVVKLGFALAMIAWFFADVFLIR